VGGFQGQAFLGGCLLEGGIGPELCFLHQGVGFILNGKTVLNMPWDNIDQIGLRRFLKYKYHLYKDNKQETLNTY